MGAANLDHQALATGAGAVTVLTAFGALAGLTVPGVAGHTPPHAALTGRLSDALAILENNLRVLAAPFLLWLLRPDTSRLGRAIGDVLMIALVATSALPVGVELGRWRGQLIPYLPQLPLEWAALAVAIAVWLTIRHSPSSLHHLALPAVLILALLTAAASLETWATPHRHPRTRTSPTGDNTVRDPASLGVAAVALAPEYAPAAATRFKVARSLPLAALGSARPLLAGADRATSTHRPPQGGIT
jgi:hypothetical protein